jgi:uroporphyrin-III C-methyltransferase
MTLRGLALLHSADVVVVDALVDPALLGGLAAEVIDAGKRAGAHGMKQSEINNLLVRLAKAGKAVVRLKGGDPMVLGRAGEEVGALLAAEVPFDVVPGVSSALAAPTLAGIPLTLRGVADGFAVISAHRQNEALPIWPLFAPQLTLVVLMGVASRGLWLGQLLQTGYPPDLPLAWVTWAGRDEQTCRITNLSQAYADRDAPDPRSPSVAILGAVVAQRWLP